MPGKKNLHLNVKIILKNNNYCPADISVDNYFRPLGCMSYVEEEMSVLKK